MDVLTSLQEQHRAADKEKRALLRKSVTESRDLTPSEAQRYATLDEEVETLGDRIHELKVAHRDGADADRQRAPFEHVARSGHGDGRYNRSSLPGTDEELRAFARGETDAIDLDLRDLRVEHNRDGSYEVRDLSVGAAAAGGTTVPKSFRAQLYEYLVSTTGVRQTNVTVLTTAGGENLTIPRAQSHGTAAIVGEGSALPENDPTFSAITLGAWKHAEFLEVTNELTTDTGIDLEGYLARQAGRAIGLKSGSGYTIGSGANEPTGVFTAAGTGVVGATTGNGGQPTADELIDLFYSVIPEYRRNGYWLMADSTVNYIRKLKNNDTDKDYLFDYGQSGGLDTFLGRPIVVDAAAPALGSAVNSIAFGDFSGYYIRDVSSIRFEKSTDYLFKNDMTAYRAILRTDGNLVDHTGAIQLYRGAST
ncbi:MAG: phage major capsid protein [Actinobacteria bacterium]|nr:phage major capsid protein [Actinomycetota bacterium]